MRVRSTYIVLVFIFTVFLPNIRSKDPYGMQPRLFIKNGHLIFQSAIDHNITFRSSGYGGIHVNDDDLIHIVQLAKTAVADLQFLKNTNVGTLSQTIQQIQDDVSMLMAVKDQVSQLEQTVTALSNRVNQVLGPRLPYGPGRPSNIRQIFTRLRRLEKKVQTIQTNLEKNECDDNPCLHGGRCEDRYNGFECECPSNWEGTRCDSDVNECSQFVGTTLGCRNGATCINTIGGYTCQCPANYYGVHCTEQHDDCTGASQEALCGHGTCVNVPRALSGQAKYRCICDEGWAKNPLTPSCDVDVDECNSPNPPCSRNPPVPCVNVPGAFHCGLCPSGYSGNGFACTDVNECEINNGGCSLSPRVDCVNIPGSRICGPCPAGYVGDGVLCTFSGACSNNNGGCHPLATCTENTAISVGYRECRCPNGYIGNGEGPAGCVLQSDSSCSSNPCVHGHCRVVGSSFTCDCYAGYSGPLCNVAANRCLPNPCKNGGVCSSRRDRYLCTCTSNWQGPTCEAAKESCGGVIRDQVGSIKFPSVEGQNYGHEINCAWRIFTTPGKVLSFVVTKLNVELSTDCSADYLALYDGSSVRDHMIGHYCGLTPPPPMNTTHNKLYIWFRSDKSVTGLGFEIEWNTTDPVCGGQLNESDYGNINSPGYPGNYPNSRDCYWTVQVPLGKRIQFHFATLMIEQHENCSYDFVQIRDGMREIDPILATYCTYSTPQPLQTSGSFAWVHFHSDEYYSDHGFHITYSSVPGIPGCGGILTAERGAFTSPNFPDPYMHVMECDWVIRIHPEERIQLSFSEFQLERHRDCKFDFIEVRDGGNENAPLFGKFCGNVAPRPILSSTNYLWIKFKADSSINGRGFRAQYITACGGMYTETEGIIKSPYFPDSYPASRICNYVIHVPPGNLVHLQFLNFTFEVSHECQYDYLEVRDGGLQNGTVLGHLCGNSLPDPLTSSYNIMHLKFASDGTVQNVGFRANYTSLPVGCGGVMTSDRGTIGTPNNPVFYPGSLNCTWLIRAPPGDVIRLTFTTFVLEDHVNCSFDFVELRDSEDIPLGRFCGSRLPPTITTTGNELLVFFQSDESISREGFSAAFDFMDASGVCGGNYLGQAGTMKSPQYPRNYPANRDCTWVIHAANGQQIRLNVTDFDLERNAQCAYDYLEIRNGGYASSPLVGKYCGTSIPRVMTSHSNQMFLHFHSDPSHTGRGFLINYDGSSTGCGGTLTSTSGSITSPNYPLTYGHNAECSWMIRVSQGSEIFLSIVDFDIEGHSECSFDLLEVYDGATDKTRKMMHLCNARQNPGPQKSTGNAVLVKFRSDLSMSGRGFHLSYHAMCNTNLTKPRGVIESPNFPSMYPLNFNCSWTIRMPPGNNVSLAFSHLLLEDSSSCEHDFIEIVQGATKNTPSEVVAKICGLPAGQQLPVLNVSSNVVTVNFVSDGSVAHDGFRLEYAVIGCGGERRENYGYITSPNYPNHYPTNIGCKWHIMAPPGSSISLNIMSMDIEPSTNCVFDHLKVYGGVDHDSPLLYHSCHTSTSSQTIASSGSHMVVEFQSDDSYTGKGFRFQWNTINRCGGYIRADKGTITSQNFPLPYNLGAECSWQIISGTNLIELTFSEFDLPESANCTESYVTVLTGYYYDDSYTSGLKYCGKTKPPVITSSENVLSVYFKGSNITATKGFQANFVTVCGGRIKVQHRGELRSPNYPHTSTIHFNCTWILFSDALEDHVTLTITHMMILSYDNCTETFLEIRDGSTPTSPVLGRYCGHRIPPAITSQGNSLHVFLRSDGVFRATYAASTSVCGGDLTAKEGVFHSPNYPNSYTISTDCVWTITSSPGNLLQISISMLDIEESDYCNKDYLEIRDGEFGPLIGRYCGSFLPSNLTIANSFWIKFHSDEDGVAQGFTADYTPVSHVDLSGESGEIASPGYSNHIYLQDTFTWTITVPPDYYVSINFGEFAIQSGGGKCYNFLEFFDGPDENAPSLNQLCGVVLPEPIVSHSNRIFMKFYTKYGANRWYLQWAAVNATFLPTPPSNTSSGSTCGEEIFINKTASVKITTPNFPIPYDIGLNCTWIFVSNPQRHVVLTFDLVDTEGNNESCHFDYITVYDMEPPGSGNWVKKRTLCGGIPDKFSIPGVSSMRKVTFQSDMSYSRSGFSLNVSEDCGGILSGQRGILQSSDAVKRLGSDPCEWVIQVRERRTIKLTFQELNIPGDGVCYSQYLMILNGGHSNSPYLGEGKYCGEQLSTVPESTSNQVYLSLKRLDDDEPQNNPVFKILYEEVSVGCDQTLYLMSDFPSVNISSPNYPNAPQHALECNFVVMSPTGTVLRVDFDVVRFNSSECYDNYRRGGYIAAYDGGTFNSPLIGLRCKPLETGSLESSGNIMLVRFDTSDDYVNSLFKATVTIHKCGGKRHVYDVITSPNYPNNYDNNYECIWIIDRGYYGGISVSFQELQLAESSSPSKNCSDTDFVEIRENDAAGSLLGIFCGRAVTRVISSYTNLYVRFKSDNAGTMKGFKLNSNSYSQWCGGYYQTASGSISTPGFPKSFLNRGRCSFYIEGPKDRRVSLTFTALNLPKNTVTGECIEKLRVLAPPLGSSDNDLWTLCSHDLPFTIESPSNALQIIYEVRNSLAEGEGFQAVFNTDLDTYCVKTSDSITSPRVRIGNVTSVQCTYNFDGDGQYTANRTFVFQLTKAVFDNNPYCSSSYLQLSTGYSYGERMCRNQTNAVQVLPYSSVKVHFSTNDSESNGFNATYQVQECGGTIVSLPAVIMSPGFPSSYPQNAWCQWQISGPYDQQMEVNFTEFQMEGNCDTDYVLLKNGQYPQSPVMEKLCSGMTPKTFRTETNYLTIVFHTDGSGTSKGFNVTVAGVARGCGGHIQNTYWNIISPNYPNPYPNNVECEWFLKIEEGYRINLTFSGRNDIEMHDTCANDYLLIEEKTENDRWSPLQKLCGHDFPKFVLSSSNVVHLLFRSNEKITADGFQLRFRKACGGNLTHDQGTLSSPGFPNNYERGLHCEFLIHQDEGNYVLLDINKELFSIRNFSGCEEEYLAIYRKVNTTNILINKLCGDTVPQRPFVTSGPMLVVFHTSYYYSPSSATGFTAKYTISACGGSLRGTQGAFTTPLHPMEYISLMSCTWLITVPEGLTVSLRFVTFELEASSQCNWDSVQVFNGRNASSPLIAKLCGKKMPPVIKSSGNQMTVKFMSDDVVHEKGFKAVFTATYGEAHGCGGTLRSPSGEIESLDVDNNRRYESELDCSWRIITDVNKVVKLTFKAMDIEESPVGVNMSKCIYDFLEIRDGISGSDPLIDRYCGQGGLPDPVTTASNKMHVYFHTDDSTEGNNGAGFRVTFSSEDKLCGGVMLVTNDTQTVTTPKYPNSFPAGVNCHWNFLVNGTENYNEKVSVVFTDFDVPCGKGYLEVSSERQESVQRFCGSKVPHEIRSVNGLNMYFSSGTETSGRGFSIKYKVASCNQNYTSSSGVIYSPGYPSFFSFQKECDMRIIADTGYTISLYFYDFQIPSNIYNNCEGKKMEIFDGTNNSAAVLGSFCGYNLPDPIFSSGENMYLHFAIPVNERNNAHYKILYTTTNQGQGCGGDLSSDEGSFTSPFYPNAYNQTIECRWRIRIPGSHTMFLRFPYFSFSSSPGCESNYLEIYEGDDEEILGARKARYCGQDSASYRSTGSTVMVKMVTDSNNTRPGFRAFFTTNKLEEESFQGIMTYSLAEETSSNSVLEIL